jgi:hypothetical protein
MRKGHKDMREKKENNTTIIEYESINEFLNYINHTKVNEAFSHAEQKSKTTTREREEFTKTKSYDEAIELLHSGWEEGTQKLEKVFRDKRKAVIPSTMRKIIVGVQGYQALVPLYLMDIPQNMVSTKVVPIKKKVITIDKNISYNYKVSTEKIIEESVKALQIVNAYEGQSFRCNLNIVFGVSEMLGSKKFIIKLRIKSSNERLNVSKMSFPLVHPSMLRRLFFRWEEVYPEITRRFVGGYGCPMSNYELGKYYKDDYLLPTIIDTDVNKLSTLDDLKNINK